MGSPWFNIATRHFCCTSAGEGCIRTVEAEIEADDGVSKAPVSAAQAASAGKPVPDAQPAFLPAGPQQLRSHAYQIGCSDQLAGPPLVCGNLLQINLGEAIQEVTLALYINGFIISPTAPGANGRANMVIWLWSPLALVEKCQVKAAPHSALWAVFKLTIFRKQGLDLCYYFACTGRDAQVQRESWVEAMSSSIQNVTLSLFPEFEVKVQPIPGKNQTSPRLLAGYLLQGGSADVVMLIYCELHCYSAGRARMVIYKDEWCEQEILSIPISDTSTVSTRRGVHCTVFGVDQYRFAARSREEKELWLRAVSNVKVKLMFEAPDPTSGEIEIFRKAVTERVEAMPVHTPRKMLTTWEAQDVSEDLLTAPVLEELPRNPPDRPEGDVEDPPEPLDCDGQAMLGAVGPGSPIRSQGDDLDIDVCALGPGSGPAARPMGDPGPGHPGGPWARGPRNLFTEGGRVGVGDGGGGGSVFGRKMNHENGGSHQKESKHGTWGSRLDDLEPEACRKLLRSIAGRIQRTRDESQATAGSKSNSADAAAGPDPGGATPTRAGDWPSPGTPTCPGPGHRDPDWPNMAMAAWPGAGDAEALECSEHYL